MIECNQTKCYNFLERKKIMEEKKDYLKILFRISSIIGTVIMCIFLYYAIKEQIFTSKEKMQLFLEKTGYFAPVMFILIQIIQIIIPLIPGGISEAVGVLIFGPVFGFIYNYIGIVIGSIIVFFIARKYGLPLLKRIFRKDLIDKYTTWLDKGKNFDKVLALLIFLPLAPDDFLCYFAGVTKISVKKYLAIIFLLKPFTIVAYSLVLVFFSDLLPQIL